MSIYLNRVVMRAGSKYEEVLCSFDFSITRKASFRIILFGFDIRFRISES